MFNKPASKLGLLNKSLRLNAALGVTKFIAINAHPGHVLLCDLSLT